MTRIRVKGFQIFKDRHGQMRCYHRNSRTSIDLRRYPLGSAEFLGECARITQASKSVNDTKPGSLGMLIKRYRADPAFTDLADRTRLDYQRIFDFLKPIEDTPLVKFDTPLVIRIRDRAAHTHGRRFGNYVRSVFSLLFEWGRERGYLTTNPAFRLKSIRKPRDAPRANRPWSFDERTAVNMALPAHMRLPIALMMYCALDPQDALRLPKSAISGDFIDTRRGKTGRGSRLPLPGPVKEAMIAMEPHNAITLAANSRGTPWTVSGFRASWRTVRLKLEASGLIGHGLTLKGMRHTVATVLAELGYDERTIADMLQQKTTAMARHYCQLRPLKPVICKAARSHQHPKYRYRGNDYSVPVAYGHREVWIKGFVGRVVIGCAAEIIADHPRSYDTGDMVFDPVHYLRLIERKIMSFDQAAPLQNWELPEAFVTLQRLLEARQGKAGKREYVQVLCLLERFELDVLHAAIKDALRMGAVSFDAIKHLLLCRVERRPPRLDLDVYPFLPRTNIATTAASSYMSLLAGGEA